MDSERINGLLKKYWECETSLEEEQELRAYFNDSEVPEPLKETAALFRYFEKQRQRETGLDFDGVINTRLVNSPKKGKSKVVSLVYNTMRIAAGVAVLVAATYLVRKELRSDETVAATGEFADTYDDPQKAYEETKKALLMISKGFGRAEQQAKKINLLNEAQEKIQSKTKEKEL